MRKGKMIAQGAHASLKVLLDAGQLDVPASTLAIHVDGALATWLAGRFTKVCVSVDSRRRSTRSSRRLVPQAWVDAIDAVTGHLPLL